MTQKRADSKSSSQSAGKESKFKLKNGLEVRLIPSSKSPVVSVQMWVKTGSADERVAEQGISHFIEHLVFKGTENFGVGEIAKTVEASGGELNAWTSFDQTVFYVNISKEFTETALDVISEMMGTPKFDPKEIDAEREVVLEEIKRTNDSPSRKGSRLLFSTLYRKHPYRLPVIGRPEVIQKVSARVLKRYFQERYSAKNMLLVIGGDFSAEWMRREVRARFSDLPGFRVRPIRRPLEPKAKAARAKIAVEAADVQEMQLHLAWPVPSAKHADLAALETLSMIYGQGESSRLVRSLRIESDAANSIGAGCFAPKDQGFFSISATFNPARLDEILERLSKEHVALLSSPVTAAEIERAIVNLESSELYGLETVDGLARKIGSLTTLLGDPSEFQKYLRRVRGFTPEQGLATARKYFDPARATVAALAPATTDTAAIERKLRDFSLQLKTAWDEADRGRKARRARPSATSPAKKRAKRAAWQPGIDRAIAIERRTLPSGIKLIARLSKSTPVVSARLAFLGGSRVEQAGLDGLTELMSRTWLVGTKHLNEVQLQERIEGQAAAISGFGGRHTAGVSAQMLSAQQADIAELMMESTFRPVFAKEPVLRERAVMLESLRTRADRPAQIASRLFMEALFENHPYARDPMGTEETLNKLEAQTVTALHGKILTPADAVFVLTGSADLELWSKRLEAAASAFAKNRSEFKKVPYRATRKAERRIFHETKKEQSHIIIGWQGLTLDDPRRYALQIAQAVLAGQGGRLFIELRDKKSLAYSVGPMSMEGVDSGYFGAFIGCAPEKGELAIEMLRAEFQKLADKSIPPDEMQRAIRYLIGSHDLGLQRASAVSSAILFSEIYGLPAEEVFTYADQLRQVTANDVRKVISGIIAKPAVLVAAGSKKPFQSEAP